MIDIFSSHDYIYLFIPYVISLIMYKKMNENLVTSTVIFFLIF